MKLVHPQIEPWLIRTDSGGRVQLWLQGQLPQQAWLRTELDNEEVLIALQPLAAEGSWARLTAEFDWDSGNPTQHYCFKLLYATGQYWLSAKGVQRYYPPRHSHFKLSRDHRPPAWVRQQVFYQIFPDRFCQGQADAAGVQTGQYLYANRHPVVRQAWGEPILSEHPARYFYGGDLAGIEARLDYLQQLGVTALYLNPIFKSGSNHKYDTEDYYQVDPHLGGDAALCSLRQAMTGRGMRLILDAVLNHTSFNHPWFNRFGQHSTLGAFQSEHSPWRHWYSFLPDNQYMSWKMHSSLPVLNLAEPEVQQQLYRAENSVLQHWLSPPYSIDGWRFDVAHMMGDGGGAQNNHAHFVAIRQAVKQRFPDAYLFGEHFFEATDWLQGNEEDGAMNYFGFALPLRAWLAGLDVAYQPNPLSTDEFADWLDQARQLLPFDNQLAQFNLLDSHDTRRFLTLLNGDLARMKLAVALLLSYPGVPCIYYGDEIGLEGGSDPDCRRCFDWDEAHWQQDLWAHYQQWIALRHRRAELQSGAYQRLSSTGDMLVFARYLAQSALIIAVNRGDSAQSVVIDLQQLPLQLDWFDRQGRPVNQASLSVQLGPVSVDYWQGALA